MHGALARSSTDILTPLLRLLRISSWVGFFALLFSLTWEVVHFPLYTCIALPYTDALEEILWATLGDGAMVLSIYWLICLVRHDLYWIAVGRPGDSLFVAILGISMAVVIEILAVHHLARWGYTALMPLIPWIEIGVTPVLQMAVVPLMTFLFTKEMVRDEGSSKIF